MRVKHPYALDDDAPSPDGAVHWGGRRELSTVDADGAFYVPDDRAEQFVASWPEADGYSLADLRVDEADGDSGGATDGRVDGSDSDDAPTCAGTTAAGDPCTREVDEPGGYCYQHPSQDNNG